MELLLANRIQNIKPSATLTITAKAAELREKGHDIISLGAGEPDFDTPAHIKQAAIEAIQTGFTKYTAVGGINSLKQAIINKLYKDNQLKYTPSQIIVTTGAKQAIYNLAQVLLNKGDEVIIPAPYWVSYPDITLLAEAKPIPIQTNIDSKFKITPQQLEAAITDRTKLLILNSPSNPSGMAYTKTELQALADILLKYPKVYILSDDIYEHILWSKDKFCNIATACPDLIGRAIIINGVSKSYAMTGWRIGYAAANSKIIKAMTKIQGQSTSNPCSIAQKAAEAALIGSQECIIEMLTEFKKRHDYVVNALNEISNVKCLPADGAFYAFFDISKVSNKTDVELTKYLLEEANVSLVPGSAFGTPGYLRLSFATSMDNLQNALARIKKAFLALNN